MQGKELLYSPLDGPSPGEPVLGGKAAQMARLESLALAPVPAWVSIKAGAHDAVESGKLSWEDFWRACREALRTRGLMGTRLAVRSSAVGEDSAQASFAGQFHTELGVPCEEDGEALKAAIQKVWKSAAAEAAQAYSRGRAGGMGVLLQQMVDARAAGVAFSADPVTGRRDVAVISAVFGLGESLVSGDVDADTWKAYESGTLEEKRASQSHALYLKPDGGTRRENLDDGGGKAVLNAAQASNIAGLARGLQDKLGAPQDIEWALDSEDRLLLLQARPVTSGLKDGQRHLWDNSNIAESYPGMISPLTFSFARRVYESVYRQFVQVMGVSRSTVEKHAGVFAQLLGLVEGRMYYELLNWYRVLSLLPGFSFNRKMMEGMMGVSKALPDPPKPLVSGNRWLDLLNLIRSIFNLLVQQGRLKKEIPRFHQRVASSLQGTDRQGLAGLDLAGLASEYRRLEDSLLNHWQAPLVNDFFAMIFFGLLGKWTRQWMPQRPEAFINDLLGGEGGVASADAAHALSALAESIAADTALKQAFVSASSGAEALKLAQGMESFTKIEPAWNDYLRLYGDRSIGELKLESDTPRENPALLAGMIQGILAGPVRRGGAGSKEAREEAERQVKRDLKGLRKSLYGWVLRRARHRVRDRENQRFERTRVFGAVRRIVRRMGELLAGQGLLDDPQDVFFMRIEELLEAPSGSPDGYQALVARRRARQQRWENTPAPPERVMTFGDDPAWTPDIEPELEVDGLAGLGCSPGLVRGEAVVVTDPSQAPQLAGRILVADRTDPGWTLLFPAAAGLLVQKGSLLSHAAIVAREMKLPCVVGIPGLLKKVKSGDQLEMDGLAGTVRVLEGGGDGAQA